MLVSGPPAPPSACRSVGGEPVAFKSTARTQASRSPASRTRAPIADPLQHTIKRGRRPAGRGARVRCVKRSLAPSQPATPRLGARSGPRTHRCAPRAPHGSAGRLAAPAGGGGGPLWSARRPARLTLLPRLRTFPLPFRAPQMTTTGRGRPSCSNSRRPRRRALWTRTTPSRPAWTTREPSPRRPRVSCWRPSRRLQPPPLLCRRRQPRPTAAA